MSFNKKDAVEYVGSREETIIDISHKIWEYAELSLKEFKSAALYIEKLKEEGFEVEESICGLPTCFSGKYGGGRPVIAILGEFDALSSLSQEAGNPVKTPVIEGGSGHGCGHNMLGAASFGAALGVKKYLEETGAAGTVIFYGCPGEEGGASKALMAREKIWKGMDAAISWHPGDCNEVTTGTTMSCIQSLYKFKGTASHAAGSPEAGRSALDAAELMNIGVQFLREHMADECRIHYSIIDGGGISPNVVQPTASLLYMVRAVKIGDAVALQKRVDKIAKAAADMTETTMEKIFVDGLSNTVMNSVLEKVMYKNMEEIEVPKYTAEEHAYAAELRKTYEVNELPGKSAPEDEDMAKIIDCLSEGGSKPLNDFLMPYFSKNIKRAGSTDVGDVSWQTPTVQLTAVTSASGSPGHSWQNVSCGGSTIGDKGAMYAAKVMCATAIDLFNDKKIIKEARKEFKERTKEGYTCPVPKGAELYVIE
ncbi:MAG: M20 family metallopeptidase [Clostridia bacterium]|nr:M20 family metallopeptidase [Clostridia bacterium]